MTELHLEISEWDVLNLDEIFHFVYTNRIGIYKNAEDVDGIGRYLSRIQQRYPADAIFLARRNGTLCGWAAFDRATESVAELGRWQPIVEKSNDEDEIASLLLEGILVYARNSGVTRLEAVFNGVDSSNTPEYERSANWFNQMGITKLEDNAYLAMQLEDFEPETSNSKLGLWKTWVQYTDEEELYRCYYDTFSTGQDSDFLDKTERERREKFDESIHNESFNKFLSCIWKDEEKIIGFIIVHTREDEVHIDLFGILEEYRGKDLAKAFLFSTLEAAKEQGHSRISIGVDISNSRAFHLYRKVGFEIESRTIIHSWKSE